jgi:serine/threonine protein kinase
MTELPKQHAGISIGSSPPPVFEGYEIFRRIGIGAGSVIYRVKEKKTGEFFSLKYVVRQDDSDKRMIEQVENEYKVGMQIDHPYLRKIYEIKRTRHLLKVTEVFLLMEYCQGVSLQQSSSYSLIDLMLIFRMVADGLNGMHHHGFLHCDIKPNNIIIAENGAIRIIDLGQSCRIGTVKNRIQGTPDYIAPEQVNRKPLSRATDVFNLGASLYWALTGKYVPTLIPKQKDRIGLATEEPTDSPASPAQLKGKIPLGFSNLVMDCIHTSPKDRPSDMATVISRLDLLIHDVAGGRPVTNNNPPLDGE